MISYRFGFTFFLATIAFIDSNHGYEHVQCDRTYNKIGCFKTSRYLDTMLVNDRDPGSKNFQGYVIQWGELGKSLHSLACRCAEKARKEGFNHISIRFFAECWGGKRVSTPRLLAYGQKSDKCVQDRYTTCSKYNADNGECAGDAGTEYIYEVLSTVKSGAVDGGWSIWSKWTDCSATCGEGEMARERTCSQPEPTGSGKKCTGSSTEAKTCLLKSCVAIADSTGQPECEKRVKGLYLTVLHRNADNGGFKWYLSKCKEGFTLTESFNALYESNERKDIICKEKVDHLYKDVLNKEPDHRYNDLRKQCFEGFTEAVLIKAILKRSDFNHFDHKKYPTRCHKLVLGLYKAILYEDENMPDFEKYFNECERGVSLTYQIQSLMNNGKKKEINCKIRVNYLFAYGLQRKGSPEELKFHIKNCCDGRPLRYQVYDFILSTEFEEKYRKLLPNVMSINEI